MNKPLTDNADRSKLHGREDTRGEEALIVPQSGLPGPLDLRAEAAEHCVERRQQRRRLEPDHVQTAGRGLLDWLGLLLV